MSKKLYIYIGLFLLTIIWIVYADYSKAKPINWFPSFAAKHKLPYGTYVLHEELSTLFSEDQLKDINQAPYTKLQDSTLKGTYFFLNNVINFSEAEMNRLLDFVDRGNNVFISTSGANVDTLNLSTKVINTLATSEKMRLKLLNPHLDTIAREFKTTINKLYFDEIDTLQTEVLGKIQVFDDQNKLEREEVNFVRRKYGNGYFYFHLYPYAFTNYNILKDERHQYVSSVLSYIDDTQPVYWDAYYKTGKSRISSPMYYILSSESLKWAYYSVLLGILLFIIFQGKRRQRYIPIITPLQNQTLAFTRTVASMYFEKGDHKAIADKSIAYFLDYIRSNLHVSTLEINDSFYEKLAARTNNTLESVKNLFEFIKHVQSSHNIKKETLLELNRLIDEFRSHC